MDWQRGYLILHITHLLHCFLRYSLPKGNKYMVEENSLYYYIRYCNIEDSILIRHVPIFNRGDFFEINSMAKRKDRTN